MENKKQEEEEISKFSWIIEQEKFGPAQPRKAIYNDLTEINTERTILDNIGKKVLNDISFDVMALLDTSIAIYEKNGDYAFGSFISEWCWCMDTASRKRCNTNDDREALNCGRWLCHENCWNDSAKVAMESGKTTDIPCVGGIRLYCVPIFANNEIIGAINIGYGNPPQDEKTLYELSHKFDCDVAILRKAALSFKPRPLFLINLAKKRLHSIALQIGKTVEANRNATYLWNAEKRSRSLLDYSPVCHKIVDLDYNLQYMNANGYTMLKLDKTDELYGKPYPFDFFPKEARQTLIAGLENVCKNRQKVELDGPTLDFEGNEIWLQHSLIPVYSEDDTLDFITVVSADITERKKNEEQIKKSLAEKTVLLQEVHHRVKNNLNNIVAMLKLQGYAIEDENVQRYLNESKDRIYSMALIHEMLYKSKDFSEVGFKDYIDTLLVHITNSFPWVKDRIKINNDVNDFVLDLNRAIPCGLLINEILMNCYKHAFPDDWKGNVYIKSEQTDDEYILKIGDDGVGLLDDVDLSASFGFGLIHTFTDQLGSELTSKSEAGLHYEIRIPKEVVYE